MGSRRYVVAPFISAKSGGDRRKIFRCLLHLAPPFWHKACQALRRLLDRQAGMSVASTDAAAILSGAGPRSSGVPNRDAGGGLVQILAARGPPASGLFHIAIGRWPFVALTLPVAVPRSAAAPG